jgi:hypothetical protein
MDTHFVKMMAFLIISFLILASSCQTDSSDDSDKLQVYNYDGTPYKGTIELVGLPWVWLDSGYHPWKLYGRIVNGKMEIDFPDVELGLGSFEYCRVYIELKDSYSTKLGLYIPSRDHDSIDHDSWVYIFYSTGSYSTGPYEPREEVRLKPGWNFVEEMTNPDWSYGNDEPYWITRLISQNIDDIYNKGYRWHWE